MDKKDLLLIDMIFCPENEHWTKFNQLVGRIAKTSASNKKLVQNFRTPKAQKFELFPRLTKKF